LVGQLLTAIVPSDQHHFVESSRERLVLGESDRYELELLHKDGSRIPVLVSGSPRLDPETGRFSGTMAVFTDITEILAHQKVEQELAVAWQIQKTFLPKGLPSIPGWEVAATLTPARQTSGDFYDFISLPNGQLGILLADVADKGMPAALYMALCRTLIRTSASENCAQPEQVFRAANQRILRDTHADLFVTVFFGALDPVTGKLTYCNAGQNPPCLFSAQNGFSVEGLGSTGIPLGITEEGTWGRKVVQLAPGDVLMLCTDGIMDAQSGDGARFGNERLLEAVRANLGRTAQGIQEALMAEVHAFVGDAPQYDDTTLMVLVRTG
jgi:sigma-B regulation protein RsbU (phosphoserine phosphatase)